MIATSVLETNIVHHCTNRCAACNHGSAYTKPYYMDPGVLERDLRTLGRFVHTGFFCLQGGEPLLHPQIVDIMKMVCQSGIANQYGILTNGRLFPKMPEEFWKQCSLLNIELRCSVYSNLEREASVIADQKAAEYGLNYRPVGIGIFRQILGNYPNGESFNTCHWRACHTIHEGHFFICPISTFWPAQFMGLPAMTDGYDLSKATEQSLWDFMYRTTPLESCKRCTGASAPGITWHETESEEQWMKESTYEPT